MIVLERSWFLQQLEGMLQEAACGEGHLVFVGGEAGVGKTTLVQRFCSASQGIAEILVGACDPLSTPRPLGPLIDVAPMMGGELERLLVSDASREHLFRALLAQLASGSRPAVLVFEDVHWADDATLDLLRFLGRRLAGVRLLLIATYRDDEVGPRHPLRVVLGDLATSGATRRMVLPPLSEQAVRVLAEGSPLDPVELHQQTAGNPFFVTEVLANDSGGIPATIRDAVLARAARLSLSERAVLEAAAVIGARVEPWLLVGLVSAEAGAVEACVAAGMLQVHGAVYAFRHELARQTILESTLPQRQLTLHQLVLAALQASPETRHDVARLAHHAEAAGDLDAVLAHAPIAARQAAAAHAHREAAAHYARALRFAGGAPLEERAQLLHDYAHECATTDQSDTAIQALREASGLWRKAEHPLNEGACLSDLTRYLVRAGHNAAAEQASRKALDLLAPLPPSPQLARAYWAQAALRMLNRDTAEAIGWSEKAIALADRFHDVATLAGAYNSLGSAMMTSGDDHGRAFLERSVAVAHAAGLDQSVAAALVNLASASGEMYQFGVADEYLAKGIAYCLERELDQQHMYLLAWQALAHMYQGRWTEATEAAMQVISRPSVAVISRITALVALGRVRARRDDPGQAAVLDEALDLAAQTETLQRLGPVRAARAEAAWLAGDRERARTEARATYELAVRHQHAWFTGELAFWRRHAGDAVEIPPWIAAPFALQINGDWYAAASEWQRLGCPYEQARALTDGDTTAQLAALNIFERLGAVPAAAALRTNLRTRGVRGLPRGPRPATRENPFKLTAREMEVLPLLAEGIGNAEIATRLHISPRTAEHHVSAVLAKLGVQSRGEAHALARRHNLVEDKHGS